MTIRRSLLLVASFAVASACGALSAQDSSAPDCGEDIRVCANGTPVGRIAPSCQFAECPGANDGAAFNPDGLPSDGQTPPPVLNSQEGIGPNDNR